MSRRTSGGEMGRRARRLPLDGVSVSPAERVETPLSTAGRSRCVTKACTSAEVAAELLGMLPGPTGAVAFVANGSGLVGWGRFATITVTGNDAAARIAGWFADQCAALQVEDSVGLPGCGPVCFVSLGFGPRDASVAVIPDVVVGAIADGEGAGTRFVTRFGRSAGSDALPRPSAITTPGQVRYADAELSTAGFVGAVAAAVARIRAGEAAKVVLAHGLTAVTQFPVDERYLLTRLAERYPTCATFAVDGLVGASPEMLISRHGTRVASRVLAGTAWPGAPMDVADADGHHVAANLLTSTKDLAEHRFAVRSVADVLGPLTDKLSVPDSPTALELANLTHLATDISGQLAGPVERAPSALDLAASLHPTAAVGGAPTRVAQAMIAELEPAPRGRYAAPVGWLDARGDGEFAIALRCAEVAGSSVRLMAGCGIVADSEPEVEAREAQIKMVPVRDALEASD